MWILSDLISKESVNIKLNKLSGNIALITCVLISIVGCIVLYSVNYQKNYTILLKQILYLLLFFAVAIAISMINITTFIKYHIHIYTVGLILLIVVEIMGHRAMGAKRWINLGFFKLQPSEIMKISLIIYLASYFHNLDLSEIKSTIGLIKPILLTVLPVILILKQPNLGTALIMLGIATGIFFLVGVQIWKFILVFVVGLSVVPFVWMYGMKDYQKQRVMTFLNPEKDPLNTGYNIIQSKITIGSGGVWGKGYLNGTQGKLEFLPERHTDFIFTILCEEFGFIGAFFVIILYTILLVYCISIILKCSHTFGRVVVAGIAINLFLHIFINLGMISGILPVVGTPLPLMSYGGSITATTLISLGLLLNVDLNRNEIINII